MNKQELQTLIRQDKKAALLVNTRSRKGRRLFFKAVNVLSDRGISLTAAHQVENPLRLAGLVKHEIENGNKLIIVGGGDGTISAIVDHFAYKDVVFSLLPLGTANSFARTLGIPLTIEGAINVIVNGKVADIELGKVNNDYFANMVSVGFTADVARNTPRWLKHAAGHFSYSISGIKQFFTTSKFKCDLILDGTRNTVMTHLVVVANGSFLGITDMSPESEIDNRRLFVITMDMMTRLDLLVFWVTFILRRHKRLGAVRYFRTQEITIETDPPRYIDIDGEATTRTPAIISLAPEALKVMVPVDFRERL